MWSEARIPLEPCNGQSLPAMGKPKKQKHPVTYLRAYREHPDYDYTLEEVAKAIGMTGSNLAKIEKGDQPYTQPVLEGAARFYNVNPWDLLNRPPGTKERLPDAMAGLTEDEKAEVLRYVQYLRARRQAA